MTGFNSLAVFLFSALALVVAGGYSLGALLLFVASITLLWKRPRLALKKKDHLLIAALLLYFLVYSANNLYHGDPLREYDAPLRFLLATPVLLLLFAYPARPAALWGGLGVGATGAGSFVLWQYLMNGIYRPGGGTTNAIQFGNMSMLLGILCLCGLAWARLQPRKAGWIMLLLLGSGFGMLGSLLSGSRGGWIALPVCVLILALHYGGVYGKRYLLSTLLTLALLLAAAYTVPQSPLRDRTELTLQQLHSFFSAGDVASSIGQRIEMWRSALDMAPTHPWLGWGKQGYMDQKVILIREGKIIPAIGQYTNAHSEYLDSLVKHGIVGLLSLLALLLVPLLLFSFRLRSPKLEDHSYALAGVCLCTSYLVFGLTTTFLTLNIGVMMLAFLMVILWSYLHPPQTATT